MARGADWNALRVKYVTGDMSYKALAQKHKLQPNLVARRGHEEKWPEQRREYRQKAATKAIEGEVDNEAERLSKLIRATDAMEDVVMGLFKDAQQFYRHIVLDGTSSEEKIFEKVDTKAIKDLTGAMKDLAIVHRNLHGMPTQAEREAQRIAAERLKMDQKRAQLDENADKSIAVELEKSEEYAK